MKDKLTTGQMARLNGISEKALRIYHREGLLVPEYVDEDSGYRYYSIFQSARLDMIQQMRAMGMGLNEIREVLVQPDAKGLEQFMTRYAAKLEREIRERQLAKEMAERYIYTCRQFMEKKVCQDFVLEHLPGKKILRFQITAAGGYGEGIPSDDLCQWEYFLRYVKRQMAAGGIPLSLFGNVGCIIVREDFQQGRLFSTEAFVEVPADFYCEDSWFRVQEIPEGDYLCLYCEGLFTEKQDWREPEKIMELKAELAHRGLEPAGDYYGEVLADTPAFHYSGRDMLLRLEIAVKKCVD